MNKYYHTVLLTVVGIVGFLMILGWAGNVDYTDQIILKMSQEEYDAIKSHLTQLNGSEPSEYEIACQWAEQNNK